MAAQTAELAGLQNAVTEAREKIKRVREERDRVYGEKERLAREFERSYSHSSDIDRQRKGNTALEATIVRMKGDKASLEEQAENLRDQLESKKTRLQIGENEVRLMTKELEKLHKQRSILLDRCKDKRPRPLVSKAQVETFLKESVTRGIQKDSIRPFNSFGLSLNMFQSTGPIKVVSGLNTSRSSAQREEGAAKKKAGAGSSPSVE